MKITDVNSQSIKLLLENTGLTLTIMEYSNKGAVLIVENKDSQEIARLILRDNRPTGVKFESTDFNNPVADRLAGVQASQIKLEAVYDDFYQSAIYSGGLAMTGFQELQQAIREMIEA